MATAALRARPLIAVLSGVPLSFEAVTAAFEGIANVAVAAVHGVEPA